MDKAKFFAEFAPRSEPFELPGGKSVPITELTQAQRVLLHELSGSSPVEVQAHVVAMGCALFDESDIDEIKKMPGRLVADMCGAILALSGLGGDEEPEKN